MRLHPTIAAQTQSDLQRSSPTPPVQYPKMALAAIFIWHFCIYEREQKLCTRDAVAPSQALLLHNSTVAFPTLGVSASPDPQDASAWFSVAEAGKDGAKVAGVWTGFP
ncbi:hypothetical protein B0A55_03992, partial [Friedmanniomyces simplex]